MTEIDGDLDLVGDAEVLVAQFTLTLPTLGDWPPMVVHVELRCIVGKWQARVRMGEGVWTDWRHAEVAVGAPPVRP